MKLTQTKVRFGHLLWHPAW